MYSVRLLHGLRECCSRDVIDRMLDYTVNTVLTSTASPASSLRGGGRGELRASFNEGDLERSKGMEQKRVR
jgi:hypothetical protein